MQSKANEIAPGLGMKITDVRSVSRELQNFIKFELDVDEFEETHLIRQDLCQNSNDNTFEEIKSCTESNNVQIVEQQPITMKVEGEDTSNMNSCGSTGLHFLINKELEQDVIVDNSKTTKQNDTAYKMVGSYVGVSFDMEPIQVNDDTVEIGASAEDNDSDCIVITEDENSSDVDIKIINSDKPNEMEKSTDNINSEITEKDILEEFEIIDEEDCDICIVPEGSQKTKKIIRRTNLVYHCPLDCTFLACYRELLINHLISHKKKKLGHQKVYACPLCSFNITNKRIFMNHIIYHEKPRFPCGKCSYIAIKSSTLKAHMITKHGVNPSCRQLETRQLQQNEDNFKCHFDPCPFTSTSEQTLKTHEWIQHQVGSNIIKNFKCYIGSCGFETFREEVFDEHLNTHRGCQLYCQQCSYKTSDWKKFKDHMITHVKSFRRTLS